jgi:hypothetical protein
MMGICWSGPARSPANLVPGPPGELTGPARVSHRREWVATTNLLRQHDSGVNLTLWRGWVISAITLCEETMVLGYDATAIRISGVRAGTLI